MSLRVWRLLTLLVAELSLTMEPAHVLELPEKLRHDRQMRRLWPLQPLCSFLHAAALLTAGALR
jgi:hypothetical protein